MWKQGGWGLLVWGALGCGQELVVPTSRANPLADGGAAPASGFTGSSGDTTEGSDDSAPADRLPLPQEPTFTMFGGAGGVADEGDGGATSAHGGSHSGGGSENHSGGTSGKSSGGGKSGGGGKSSGGAAAGSGGKSSGGGAAAGGGGTSSGGDPAAEASGGDAPLATASLLFTEYVEGSGSFKALEIYALETTSLEACELQTYFNGKLEPARLQLHGLLSRGGTQVLCSTALAEQEPTHCDRSTSLTFNGNDALALACGGTTLDVIGQIGFDPGASWGEGATVDHTLRRSCSMTTGRTDGSQPFLPTADWEVLASDSFSDLGVWSCITP
jgi:hypothetical protein